MPTCVAARETYYQIYSKEEILGRTTNDWMDVNGIRVGEARKWIGLTSSVYSCGLETFRRESTTTVSKTCKKSLSSLELKQLRVIQNQLQCLQEWTKFTPKIGEPSTSDVHLARLRKLKLALPNDTVRWRYATWNERISKRRLGKFRSFLLLVIHCINSDKLEIFSLLNFLPQVREAMRRHTAEELCLPERYVEILS